MLTAKKRKIGILAVRKRGGLLDGDLAISGEIVRIDTGSVMLFETHPGFT